MQQAPEQCEVYWALKKKKKNSASIDLHEQHGPKNGFCSAAVIIIITTVANKFSLERIIRHFGRKCVDWFSFQSAQLISVHCVQYEGSCSQLLFNSE